LFYEVFISIRKINVQKISQIGDGRLVDSYKKPLLNLLYFLPQTSKSVEPIHIHTWFLNDDLKWFKYFVGELQVF
jgi:hypothetical protein